MQIARNVQSRPDLHRCLPDLRRLKPWRWGRRRQWWRGSSQRFPPPASRDARRDAMSDTAETFSAVSVDFAGSAVARAKGGARVSTTAKMGAAQTVRTAQTVQAETASVSRGADKREQIITARMIAVSHANFAPGRSSSGAA